MQNRWSCLHKCAMANDAACTAVLLELGAKTELRDEVNPETSIALNQYASGRTDNCLYHRMLSVALTLHLHERC